MAGINPVGAVHLVLFISLVITAWRHSMRMVILYCGITFVFDVFLAAINNDRRH